MGGRILIFLRLYISVALQQKTANFKSAMGSRLMQWSALTELRRKEKELTCCMKMMKIKEGSKWAGDNYSSSRFLTPSASAITWQSTETPSPFAADSKMSGPPATRAAAAACTQE
jgi:hypothetical protein